jgi:hypothetical protein
LVQNGPESIVCFRGFLLRRPAATLACERNPVF